jgi:hypothetical protein
MARPNPYMSDADLFRARQVRLRMLFGMGILMGIYMSFMQLLAAGLLQRTGAAALIAHVWHGPTPHRKARFHTLPRGTSAGDGLTRAR